ncbi:hypothetical protein HII36_50865 [Nonomuraea sp. NN258]|uniref:hypothetical protein n=1 Tax=Nonomuraea antri TaxID=2730852 RepID=UPI0015696FC5|nr:hypothetical protein [Nonomuraea antri]NRQ40073.1 hypothetical protein [Nonomuraea antri]
MLWIVLDTCLSDVALERRMTEPHRVALMPRGVQVLRLFNWTQMSFWALSLVQPFLAGAAMSNELWLQFPPLSIVSVMLALSFGLAAGLAASGRTWVWIVGLVASVCELLYALLLVSGVWGATMVAVAVAALLTFVLSVRVGTRSWFR